MSSYVRISQDKYDKAKWQLRSQLNGVFRPFDTYGLHIFIEGAIDECIRLTEQFAMRVRGKDTPIQARDRYGRFFKDEIKRGD